MGPHFTEEETEPGREHDLLSARASGCSSGTFSGLDPSPQTPPPCGLLSLPTQQTLLQPQTCTEQVFLTSLMNKQKLMDNAGKKA